MTGTSPTGFSRGSRTTIGTDMSFHVPFSESPFDEFQAPDGEWYSTFRAVTYDGWLLWKHALPEDPYLWPQLNSDTYESIQLLAKRVHIIHQLFPDYRRLDDTPFTVSRWWDPTDDSGEWHQGERILCRIKGYTATDVLAETPHRYRSLLHIQPRSKHWVEISLA
jgi:hypothetical protein